MELVTIYGKPSCPYCTMAKQLCEEKNFEFNYIDIFEAGMSVADLQEKVGQPVRTVPQIFVGNQHVGGYTDFYKAVTEGTLI